MVRGVNMALFTEGRLTGQWGQTIVVEGNEQTVRQNTGGIITKLNRKYKIGT